MSRFKIALVLTTLLMTLTGEGTASMKAQALETHDQNPYHDIARRVIIGFDGTSKDDEGVKRVCADLKAGNAAGVILFNYNIVNPEQTRQLIADLKAAAGRPILIAVDQEGGKVQRLKADKGFTTYTSAHKVASTMTPEEAYDHYHALARELADLGFNLNFGPVLDLHSRAGEEGAACPVIGGLERSYGSDPETITKYATAFVKAHKDAGVQTCLKHYPGHGLASSDSHAGFVDITKTFQPIEREPFRLMIKAGLADMIMTAHLMDKRVDEKDPTSISQTVLQKWLRSEDGFKGQIITDDLHMGAIGEKYPMADAVVKAINAGSDLIIISNNKNAAPKAQHFEYIHDLPAFYAQVQTKLEGH